ncbi:unnamed protein product, partial [Didymodactylos carnosus]
MNNLLVNNRQHYCLVYLHDIIIFSKPFDDHIKYLDEILLVLCSHHFQLNTPKCSFVHQQMDYLAHTIDKDGICPSNCKIQAILDMQEPTTLAKANKFIGSLGYYRKFISNFARLAAPVHRLKEAITHPPLFLQFALPDLPLTLSTDASAVVMDAVLKQQTPNGLQTLYYFSQVLPEPQKRYSTIQKEAYTIQQAFTKLYPYLYNYEVIIETDHCPLCNFYSCVETKTFCRYLNFCCKKNRGKEAVPKKFSAEKI